MSFVVQVLTNTEALINAGQQIISSFTYQNETFSFIIAEVLYEFESEMISLFISD